MITLSLAAEIARRRASDPGYLTADDEWIVNEIHMEELNRAAEQNAQLIRAQKQKRATEKQNEKNNTALKLRKILEKLNPPSGGQIKTFSIVPNFTSWKEAVTSGAPNTYEDCEVMVVADKYKKPKTKSVNLVLANFGKNIEYRNVLAWGKKQGLARSSPYHVFTLTKKYPKLHKVLRERDLAVVSTTPFL